MPEHNKPLVGTCEKLCPEKEEKLRKENKLIHFYEKNSVLIKEFSRSAADKKTPEANDLRTFGAINETLNYLFNRILLDQRKSFNVRYDFIFDRCRAVRQEMVIQKFSAAQTAKVLEPIVMFLSFSLYRLSGCDMAIFDKKICTQHLNECLLKCLSCYEELDGDDRSDEYTIEKRSLIEGIYLMLNLGESSALHRALKLNNALKTAYIVKMSIRISINFHLKHFFKVIRDIQDLSHIVAAVASLKLPHIRMEVLSVFSIAYSSKTLKVPVDFITKILVYDEKSKLVEHLRHLGIYDETDENPTAITFNRGKFNRTVLMQPTPQNFVDSKLHDHYLPDLVLMQSI